MKTATLVLIGMTQSLETASKCSNSQLLIIKYHLLSASKLQAAAAPDVQSLGRALASLTS